MKDFRQITFETLFLTIWNLTYLMLSFEKSQTAFAFHFDTVCNAYFVFREVVHDLESIMQLTIMMKQILRKRLSIGLLQLT